MKGLIYDSNSERQVQLNWKMWVKLNWGLERKFGCQWWLYHWWDDTSVCVNRSLDRSIWPNYEVLVFHVPVSYCSSLRLCRLLLWNPTTPPLLPYYLPYLPHEFIRPPGCPLYPSHYILLPHEVIRRPGNLILRTSILNPHPETPPPSGSYCVILYPNLLLLLSSHEIPAKVARSCFYVSSWRYQSPLLRPPPTYPFSPANTSNIGCNTTHCAMVAYHLPI